METKQTSIQIKVDKSISNELKRMAKKKDMIYSAYVRKLLLESLDKAKMEQQDEDKSSSVLLCNE